MLQQENPRSNAEYREPDGFDRARVLGFDIQAELNRLEELILDNPRIPLTRKTIVDEEQLLDRLDYVRINLPEAFEEAMEIVRQKEEILLQAEEYAQEIVDSAKQQAAQFLDELGLVRQAEGEAAQIRQAVRQECEDLQQQTLTEIEQMRMQAVQELEQMRQVAIAECEEIQDGADEYADAVLLRIEQQLGNMLRVIRNGRQQLRGDFAEPEGEEELPVTSYQSPVTSHQSPVTSDR